MVWQGARPLIGTVIGVGIFALPYAFSRAGFGIGLIELILVGSLNLVALFLYADLVLARPGHDRFTAIVGRDLGFFGTILASLFYFGSHLGALIAYVLVGGTFAYTVFSPLLGGPLLLYQVVFWTLGSVCMFGGLFFVAKLQAYFVPLFFLLIAILLIGAFPFISSEHLAALHPEQSVLPLGVLLFAFAGMSAVPEMRDVLGEKKGKLKQSLLLGTIVAGGLYTLFTLAIVGVTGEGTTPQAIDGLQKSMGPVFVMIGSLFGLLTIFSAYTTIGVSLMDTLLFDQKFRYVSAWGAVAFLPMIAILLGAKDLVGVIGFTGGVMSSFLGMLLIISYERARYSAELPKRALRVPQWLVALSFFMFVLMFVLTLWDALG